MPTSHTPLTTLATLESPSSNQNRHAARRVFTDMGRSVQMAIGLVVMSIGLVLIGGTASAATLANDVIDLTARSQRSSANITDASRVLQAPKESRCAPTTVGLVVRLLGAATGSASYVGLLTNRSSSACTLDGYPRVVVRFAAGFSLRLVAGKATMADPNPARPGLVVLRPGGHAQFVFAGQDWRPTADGGRGAACPRDTSVSVTLPGTAKALSSAPWPAGSGLLCAGGGVGAIVAVRS